MKLKFTKMHGFGNDFAIFDFRKENQNYTFKANDIIFVGDRNYGIGADQILVIYKSNTPDDDKGINVDIKIYNQDGTEAQQCGNGLRCITGYLAQETEKPLIRVSISGGKLIPGKADKKVNFAKINMGIPTINGNVVEIGNKHKIEIVQSFEKINRTPDPDFNISYVQVKDRTNLFVRTIERGVGETLSCGSGVCASVAYCIQNNLTEKSVNVMTRGSDIMNALYQVTWNGAGTQMLQSGGYTFVFTGEIEVE